MNSIEYEYGVLLTQYQYLERRFAALQEQHNRLKNEQGYAVYSYYDDPDCNSVKEVYEGQTSSLEYIDKYILDRYPKWGGYKIEKLRDEKQGLPYIIEVINKDEEWVCTYKIERSRILRISGEEPF
mgnify:CR=1 FL=1|jgi:hypothetical protein